jgi:signal transduction histidine kinase/CheY-like chemotaxis protein
VSDATQPAETLSLSATIARLADALASARSASEIYGAAIEGVRSAVGVDRTSILLFDPDGVMRFKAWHGLSEAYRAAVEGHTPWRPGEPAPSPITVHDVLADPELAAYTPVFASENIRALAFVPVVLKGRTIGKFMLYWAQPHSPSPAALDAATTIAAFVALAVDRARQEAASREQEQRMHAALEQEAQARERLTRLAEGSQRLQISLDPQAVLREVLTLARNAIAADAYAVWRRSGDKWYVAASANLDDEFTRVELLGDDSFPLSGPIVAEDVQASAMLGMRHTAYASAGIRSLMLVPMQIRGRPSGTVVFYFRTPHPPSEIELRIAEAVGQLAASAISSAELFAEQQTLRQSAVRAAERAEFLAEISGRLTSLDYEQNLAAIAHLAVPRIADWCVVDLLEGGELRRLAGVHSDPRKMEFAEEIRRRYPPRRDDPGGLWHVLQTGEPKLYEHIDDSLIEAGARDPEHLAMLRSIGLRSAILTPLKRGRDVFGVLTLVVADSGRSYDAEDLSFAMELAERASYAIENARLYRQAQEANRAKDEFLAALSHELRTPLNAILGWASILRARPDGEVARGLDVIYRNAVVQAQLVEDLLDASRIVSGRMSIELKDTPLRPIVEAAIETILPQAVEKAIEITSELPPSDVLIRGDSARLQQVFWNILSNAVKFTPRSGRIRVRTTMTPAEIVVNVQDNGTGIRPEVLPYIFDRFKQADASTTTRRYRGLGLGLTLSRQLTEMHGGRITASSNGPGLGSTFSVALPLVEPAAIAPVSGRRDLGENTLAGMRILAVDDDPDSLEMLMSLLRSEGAAVIGAGSAVEALDLVQRERPTVVVSDIAMPDHDGYWLAEQLRRLAAEGGPVIPSVALTAFANATARERAIASGFVAHLSKPFNPEQLFATLRTAVA